MTDKWKTLERRLNGYFGVTYARAGGHHLSMYRTLVDNRLVTIVYVDGWISGKWFRVDAAGQPVHPRGRFWRPVRQRPYPLKSHGKLCRAFGKKRADELVALKTTHLTPYWPSNSRLIAHLKKHFPDLELVDKAPGAKAEGVAS